MAKCGICGGVHVCTCDKPPIKENFKNIAPHTAGLGTVSDEVKRRREQEHDDEIAYEDWKANRQDYE